MIGNGHEIELLCNCSENKHYEKVLKRDKNSINKHLRLPSGPNFVNPQNKYFQRKQYREEPNKHKPFPTTK